MRRLGLYLHIPFCRSKCLYCDFCSFPHSDATRMEQYVARLCKDLVQAAPACRDCVVDTVYFGGGTPTILSPEQLITLLDTVRAQYALAPDAEITLECNPATGSAEGFAALRRAGFNRVSIGLQSVHENERRRLGRRHDFSDFCRTFAELRQAGFENISADVMFGIPEQTVESYLQTLARLCELAPEHISAYGLLVEEGTPFATLAARGQLPLPDEDAAEAMYFSGIKLLEAYGYRQYEISNFAKAGYESRHNLKYWSCDEYIGFGPAAYSDFDGERFGNSRDLTAYLEGRSIEVEREHPDPTERENEYVMLRMRLSDGISAEAFQNRFGKRFEACFGKALSQYVEGGFVQIRGDAYSFTPRGMYVSNTILSEVLEF